MVPVTGDLQSDQSHFVDCIFEERESDLNVADGKAIHSFEAPKKEDEDDLSSK